MESRGQLDAASPVGRVALLLFAAALLNASEADVAYMRGMAFAQNGNWNAARTEFLRGRTAGRSDKRFPTELAGVAFRQKRYGEAVHWLRSARRMDPSDPYLSDFLATTYFLLGNTEAAILHWNAIGKPKIATVHTPHGSRTDPVLLHRAFPFGPGSTLSSDDLDASHARINQLGVLGTAAFRLDARPDGDFDVTLVAHERNGWGGGRAQALVSALRGVAYQTVHLDYYNAGGSATNVTSMLRWDRRKRRVLSSVSAPFRNDPRHRYSVVFDLRDEDWDHGGIFDLRRTAVRGELTTLGNGAWSFTSGAELSHRRIPSQTGFQLKHIAAVRGDLLRLPDRRITTDVTLSAETGKLWAGPSRAFERLQAGIETHWFPRMRGDDFAVTQQVRAGSILGGAPFDELFMLGLERDNDLWMRAHVGTRAGRKGSAPMTRRYLLFNNEVDKNLYSKGIVDVKLSPFLDIGRGAATKWMWDTGAQLKLRVLGIGFAFVYGKDVRTGRNAWYLTALR